MPLIVYLTENGVEVFKVNVSHRLGLKTSRCGMYEALWRKDEDEIRKARDMIDDLQYGLAIVKASEDFFRKFDAPKGWRIHEHFASLAEDLLKACREHPDADISVCR